MAVLYSPHSVSSLRAISYRISSTPTKHLPPVAVQIASSIWNCKDVLSAAHQPGNEVTNIAHRFKTTITSLLQDRTVEGRWAAVVLAKAAIEAGGVATLSKANPWVKSLIAILKKPDPPTTHQLAVISLTRIFMLSWDYSNLVREITTPALPAFISACLANAERGKCSAVELAAVLESFAILIARHPTIFRTQESHIRAWLLKILSVPSSDDGRCFSKGHQESAARLLVLLHHCTPKNGAADAWDDTWKSTINATHATCDMLFRSVIEDLQPRGSATFANQISRDSYREVGSSDGDTLGLGAWNGIFPGSARLIVLLNVLTAHLEITTADSVTIRIGLVVELISRIMSLTLDVAAEQSRINHQIPKDEREALFCALPSIHVAAMDLIVSLLRRFAEASAPFIQTMLELTLAESTNSAVRAAAYTTLKVILEISGPSLSKADVVDFGPLMSAVCVDLLPQTIDSDIDQSANGARADITNGIGTKTGKKHTTSILESSTLTVAAAGLLAPLPAKVNPSIMPRKLRHQIERTAILTKNKDVVVACVLNPMPKHACGKFEKSLLPILAREFPDLPEVEALLRPRMPLVAREATSEADAEDEEADNTDDFIENGLIGRTELYELTRQAFPGRSVSNGGSAAPGQEEEDDLYSITPPQNQTQDLNAHAAAGTGSDLLRQSISTTKRSAEAEAMDTAAPAKRQRMSPSANPADAVASTAEHSMPSQQIPAQSGVPEHQAEPFGIQNMSQASTEAVHAAITTAAQHDDPGTDDSDFEMPPLTMEPDTDLEDEESDGDEG